MSPNVVLARLSRPCFFRAFSLSRWSQWVVCLCLFLSPVAAFSATIAPVSLSTVQDEAVGRYISYFQETEKPLTLEEAQSRFSAGPLKHGRAASISLGIGVRPVWMKFSVANNEQKVKNYRLAIETPWLDQIDTWLVKDGRVIKYVKGGDAMAFEDRPMAYRYYAFHYDYPPGEVDVYIRVESLGPMALPVRLSEREKAISRDISSGYQYGVLYGIMSALALYNLVLFVFIRQKEYGLYSLYLLGFVINSLSYTGHLHTIITEDFGPYFQDWLDIFLMITYSVAGLHFARVLLASKSYAPRLDKLVRYITMIIPAGMLIGFLLNYLVFAIVLAFILNCGFVLLFVAMGVYALKNHQPFAIIFLVSSVTAAICITVSTLAVAGLLIPYNDYTFKAIEAGMAFEAILLAVILARQFRMAKLDTLIAEQYARTDPLTRLNNRRGCEQLVEPIWQNILREKREASVVLLDIDSFKEINDTFGHAGGDEVLRHIARCINETARKGDVSARWGGEEFLIFLPETDQQQALTQAERLRAAIEQRTVIIGEQHISLTASFGVAGSAAHQIEHQSLTAFSIEQLINRADQALYRAKESGKNRVCTASP